MSGNDYYANYIASLRRLVQDDNRAALAALRRGLSTHDGVAPEMHRYVVPWLSPDSPPWQASPLYQVAALFAWHQDAGGARDDAMRNLGASCARLKSELGRDSLEGRFVALLNSHQDDLYPRLRNIVGLLRSNNIPVNWSQLLSDIHRWGWESRSVQRAWANAYWQAGSARDDESSDES